MSNAWLAGESQNKGGGNRETRWLTPKYLVAALGEFDLDPAGALGWELAKRTYHLEYGADGLRDPWEGRVWLNPPYNRAEAAAFLRKMVQHNHGTALLFARTETAIFHEAVWGAATGILFLKGRITFHDSDGRLASANAGAPSCLVAYGASDALALRAAVLENRLQGQFVIPVQ